MTRGSRGWRWARVGGAAIVGTVMAVMASGVASAADVTGVAGADGGEVVSVKKVDGTEKTVQTSAITIKIGDDVLPAYCIDAEHGLAAGAVYTEESWERSGVDKLGKIKWLLNNGYPGVDAATIAARAGASTEGLGDAEKINGLVYAANQVAIWQFSDGVALNYAATATGRDGFIYKVYTYLVEAANKALSIAEPAPTLKITPATATANVGSKAGPFTVQANGGDIQLTATGGSVVDQNGNTITTVKSGGQFWLTATAAGTVKVKASGTVTIPTGRVFIHGKNQKIILAGAGKAAVTAEASAAFGNAPTLPVTGASVAVTAAVGLVLVGAGVFTVVTLRRRSVRFTA